MLLINYIIAENLFVYLERSSVKHAASRFSARKNVTHTKKKNRKKERKKKTRLYKASQNSEKLKRLSLFVTLLA